ncbi:DegT/DnrJ/EryC1/StrS family aminotransferase [Verrucomicrobiales bacterium]|nr:DegT/DnrJ/EryC1/StrS family aminotransferase [Verrucomicrobiales bacterium]MDB3941729.1 DegT/DnrJ/EryC1/StrS family aminotransferase [Verrucomicrobiales bacterium]MDC3353270.1 DegT/DnrJ/EryC1/StrS family aminotransferase [Verrucomicrobiales bacterium]
MYDEPSHVTRPLLPPLEEFLPSLEQIWKDQIVTNNGPFEQKLEQALRDYLGVSHIALFNNGTTALLAALKALGIEGEVITTPFSFVATSHVLEWSGIKPVFSDIERTTLNLDPGRIEEAVTTRTTAILPVHCYGNPCDVDAIEDIAARHDLKVIFDAAHAFAVEDSKGSVLRHGDLSVLSFHATKVFNTFEGGAVVCPDLQTKQKLDRLKNFGFVDEDRVEAVGINGKMNEICAAFGLLQLKYIDEAINRRSKIASLYREALQDTQGIHLLPRTNGEYRDNNSYFSILVDDDYPLCRDGLYRRLRDHNIFARRYFFPLISDMPMYSGLPSATTDNLPIAQEIAGKVLCLPIYPTLHENDQERVIELIVD